MRASEKIKLCIFFLVYFSPKIQANPMRALDVNHTIYFEWPKGIFLCLPGKSFVIIWKGTWKSDAKGLESVAHVF